MKSLVPKRDKCHFQKKIEFPPKSVLYLVGIEKTFINFAQNAISFVLFCHVFSLTFQNATNSSLLSLQNAIYPLNQSQRTIPRTVNNRRSEYTNLLCKCVYFNRAVAPDTL